ncbi:MAG: prepilin-type N-terminal cleavage/methylation domain-containing protein [Tepidisphaeraceae bacterium]
MRTALRGRVAPDSSGFTLIEMSIVLVVIGLIVGGVLVGQDLIRAAYVRATISQVEKFNTAVNTFYGKYQALPGDMNYATALNYGFATIDYNGSARGGAGAGSGNGDGLIDGYGIGTETPPNNLTQLEGETSMFWSDLTYANGMNIGLVPGSFGSGALFFYWSGGTFTYFSHLMGLTTNVVSLYLPEAKIGGGNYFYVYENGVNYYGLSVISGLAVGFPWLLSSPGLMVSQAYNIDRKVDDGIATSGNVQANYMGYSGAANAIMASPSAAAGSYTATTCYDSNTGFYATSWGSGNNVACALTFKMQGGD